MKGIKKFLSIIVLIVLIWTDFLNPISYAIEQEDLNFEINKNTDSYNENNIDIEDDSEEKNSYSFYIGEENKEGINIESEYSGDVDLDDGGLKLDWEISHSRGLPRSTSSFLIIRLYGTLRIL